MADLSLAPDPLSVVGGKTPVDFGVGTDQFTGASAGASATAAPAAPLTYEQQVLQRAAAARARLAGGFGAAPAAAPAVEAAAPAAASTAASGSSAWDAIHGMLTQPRSLWGMTKAGVGAVAGPAMRLGSTAATILPAAGVLASKMAGGTVAAGLNPSLMVNALGEGYARYAPTWMGGLNASENAAADSQGASDIEGRFGAMPAPAAPARPIAAAPVSSPAMTGGAQPEGLPTAATGPVTAAPFIPGMTAATINGTGVPASGTGAFVNNGTGAVTNFDDRNQPGFGANSRMVSASEYDRGNGFAPSGANGIPPETNLADQNHTWMGNAVGAIMNQRANYRNQEQAMANKKLDLETAIMRNTQAHNLATIGLDYSKLGVDAYAKRAAAEKDTAQAETERELQARASAEPDPMKRASILARRNVGVTQPNMSVPMGAYPMTPGAPVPVLDRATGKITMTQPTRPFTQADLEANVKKSGKTRAEVLRDAVAAGYTPASGL